MRECILTKLKGRRHDTVLVQYLILVVALVEKAFEVTAEKAAAALFLS
jgi:hypothetical protein